MAAKGRSRALRGEAASCVKLTEKQVLAIRSDDRPQHVIARDYGVTGPAIHKIKRRKSWGWLK